MARRSVVSAFALVLLTSTLAQAQSTNGFWQGAARGLQFIGWRPGTGDVGVTRHMVGDGWSVRTTRDLDSFDVYGGMFGWEFSDYVDPVTGQTFSANLTTEASIRRRGIPTARLEIMTNQTGTTTPVPVNYDFWINTGAQDVRLSGTASLEATIDFNVFGFYDLDAFLSNRGDLEFDGLGISSLDNLDTDIGPISISGNIFADILAAITAPIFDAAGLDNPFAVISGRAKLKNQLKQRDLLLAKADMGEQLTEDEVSQILQITAMESIFGGRNSDTLQRINDSIQLEPDALSEGGGQAPARVPEPLSLLCWSVGGLALLARRRRLA